MMNRQYALTGLVAAVVIAGLALVVNHLPPANPESDSSQSPAVQATVLQQWQQYLTEYPQGFVGAEQKMLYRFNRPVIGAALVGKTELQRVSMSPMQEFSALWLDTSTLQLTPVGPLPSGNKLQLTLHSKDLLFDVPLADFTHPVQVLPQQISLREVGFQQADSNSALSYQVEVHTLDPVSQSQIKTMLAVSQTPERSLTIEWQAVSPRLWRATVLGLQKTKTPQMLLLQWQDKPEAENFSAKRNIPIPVLEQFALLTSQVQQQQEQRFELRFSEPLAKQDLTGLVKINEQAVRTKVHGNVLQLFPDTPLKQKVRIWISRQISASSGQLLGKDQTQELQVSSMLPQISFLDGGFILPQAERLLIPVEVTNIKAVQLKIFEIYSSNIGQFLQGAPRNWQSDYGNREVGRYIAQQELTLQTAALDEKQQLQLDVTALVGKHRGSILRLEARVLPQHSLYACDTALKSEPLVELERLNFDGSYQRHDEIPEHLWRFYQSEGYYDWDERRNPCKAAYFTSYNDNVNASKVFIASNIGLLSKQGSDQQLHVLTTNLQTGQPAAGHNVSVMNYQQQQIGSAITDAHGFATIQPEGVPFYLKAQNQGDVAYLRIPANESLPTGQFDTSGVKSTEGVKGFFYAERNVWRPGDAIHLMLILQDKNQLLPHDFPVTLELFDPKSQKVKTVLQRQQSDGFYRFDLATDNDAPTGNWHVVAKVGASYFDTTLKIENILPNRLKIELNLPKTPISAAPRALLLTSAWLNGAQAQFLKADVELKLSTTKTQFDGYANYQFDDVSRKFAAESKKIFEGKLDAKGQVQLQFQPELNTPSPGALKAMFIQRVFEPNGQFSTQYRQTKVLPYAKWVGLQLPEEVRLSTLEEKASAAIALMLLDAEGKPISNGKIQLQLQQLKWRWWWEKADDNSTNYVSDEEIKKVEDRQLFTDAQGAASWLMYGKDYPAGRYRLTACVTEASPLNHCSSEEIYIGWGYGESTSRDGATRLSLSSDAASYQVGDVAKVHLPAGPDRQVLLSLENGSKVLEKRWAAVKKDQDLLEIPLTHAMVPNVYIHVTQIQPHQQRQSDTPLRSYGILNLAVSDAKSHLQPQLKTPAEVAPESEFTIEVSEKSGRAMTYTLALVDEGLLGITDFHVPEPHAALYQREALGVKTWDLFDDVVGAYSADLSHLLAVGGSDLIPKRDGQRERRFKPIVQFFGPLTLKAGETATQQIKLPPYMGAVRVMVVAGDGYAYGQQESTLTVTQPLTILSTVPRLIGPGEEFALPVAVFLNAQAVDAVTSEIVANPESVKPQVVKVTVQGDALLAAVQADAELHFSQPGEQTAMLRIKANQLLGTGKLTVTARLDGQTATEVIDLPVRSANSPQQRSVSRLLKAGESWQPHAEHLGMPGTNQQWLTASRQPDFGFTRLELELTDYPFMCLEQATSKVLPSLYSGLYQTPTAEQSLQIQQNIQQHLRRLGKYQQGSGQFSYWPGASMVEEWANLYAGYFMLRAQQQGYTVPAELLKSWLANSRQTANSFNNNSSDGLVLQGWRLWLLAMANQADVGAMNRLREELLLSSYKTHAMAHHLLALAYAEQSLPDVALALQQHGGDVQQEKLPGVLSSPMLQQLIQLELATALQQSERRWALALTLADELKQQRGHNTIEKAWTMAVLLQQFGQTQQDAARQSSELTLFSKYLAATGNKPTVQQAANVWLLSDPAYTDAISDYQPANFGVTNTGSQDLYLTLTQQGVPAEGQEQAMAEGLSLQVQFSDLQGQVLDPANIRQGTDFIAQVEIKNTSATTVQDLALLQVFPAGWQLRNTVLSDDPKSPQLEFQQAGDDRLQSFFPLARGETIRLQATLNASFVGRYYLPAWTVSSMYNPKTRANNLGQWVEVLP
jgi:alpha-2-macroglobulin